jgi:hypothetical protein
MILTPSDLARAQAIAQALLLQAVNDEHGRDEGDSFYKIVTENRDGPSPLMRAKYSSCADLAHWLLRSLGVRADWLNRNDDGDAQPWRSGVNLNWLCARPIGKCPLATRKLGGEPAPGDVFVENNVYGGHVFCAVDYVAKTDTLISAEYGQPGGKLKTRSLFKVTFDKRALGHLRLADVLGACSAPVDFSGLQDRMTGEELDALGDETPGL